MSDDHAAPDPNAEFWVAADCAAYLNIAPNTWHRYVKRPGVKNPTPQPVKYVGRTPVWNPAEVTEWARRRYRATNS